jgi:hypothetical protein
MEELCNHLAEDGKADEAYVQTILASFDAKGKDLENQLQNEVTPVPSLISVFLLHAVPASFLLYIICLPALTLASSDPTLYDSRRPPISMLRYLVSPLPLCLSVSVVSLTS